MARTDPLIVFVHIPKTAGSTVNAALTQRFRHGFEHCESIIDDAPRLTRVANSVDWISGHVPFHLLRGRLGQVSDRPLRIFSVMREPVAQVCSHYNWLIEIHRKGGQFYRNHPDHIRKLSQRIRASDNSDPAAIIENISSSRGLFLNIQSKMIVGRNFDWNSGQLLTHLRKYEFIGTPRDIDKMLVMMCGAPPKLKKRHNAAQYHFDRDIFDTPRLRNHLMRNNYLDWMLFQTMKSARPRAAISAEFRRHHSGAALPPRQQPVKPVFRTNRLPRLAKYKDRHVWSESVASGEISIPVF